MRRRSGPDGYGVPTKLLHWLTVVLVTCQFVSGYGLGLDDCDLAAGLSGAGTSDASEDRLDRLEDACEARADGADLVGGSFDPTKLHVLLGLTILTIAVVRPLWRRYDGFPPWSDSLSAGGGGWCTGPSRA